MRSPFALGVIPLDWTPEQAEAAIELLDALSEHLWILYGDDIAEDYRQNATTELKPIDPRRDDDLPF